MTLFLADLAQKGATWGTKNFTLKDGPAIKDIDTVTMMTLIDHCSVWAVSWEKMVGFFLIFTTTWTFQLTKVKVTQWPTFTEFVVQNIRHTRSSATKVPGRQRSILRRTKFEHGQRFINFSYPLRVKFPLNLHKLRVKMAR